MTQGKTLQSIRSQLGYHVLFEEFCLTDAASMMEGKKSLPLSPMQGEENLDYPLAMGVPRLDKSSEFSLQLH